MSPSLRRSCACTRPRTACRTARPRSSRIDHRDAGRRASAASYRDPSPRLAGLTWGAEDLSAAIGARPTPRRRRPLHRRVPAGPRGDHLRLRRCADVAAIDTVFVDFRDRRGAAAECLRGRARRFYRQDGDPSRLRCRSSTLPSRPRPQRSPRPQAMVGGVRGCRAMQASSASTARCTTGRIWPRRTAVRPGGAGPHARLKEGTGSPAAIASSGRSPSRSAGSAPQPLAGFRIE